MNEHKIARAAKLVLVLVLIWVSVETALFVRAGRATAVRVDALVVYAQDALPGTVAQTDTILQRIGSASDEMAGAAKEQRKQALETTKQVGLLVGDLRGTAAEATASLHQVNEKVLPELTAATAEVSLAVRMNSEELQQVLRTAQKEAEALYILTSDPQWLTIAAHMSSSAEHIDNSTAHLDEGTKLMLERLRQALKPGNFILSVIKSLLGIGSQARIAIGK
jgi:hypothetical protein